ncbi:MAG: ATPase [Pseudomonadota bacterium]
MIYETPQAFLDAADKRITLFGMSGLGKTHLSQILRAGGDWFHYSIDYRIGTAYMGEFIADDLKRHAMKQPYLARLLKSDSIYIGSNITFGNLTPLSNYLGKPGDATKGGLPIEEYSRRQEQHERAELNALLDTPFFIERARDIYGYGNFVCDTGGSIVEVVDPDNPNDEIMKTLAAHTLPVWIEGDPAHTQTLIDRFARDPKPLCFRPEFLAARWAEHGGDDVDPDAFMRGIYAAAIHAREPRYAKMARWGVSISPTDVAKVRDATDVITLVAEAIGKRRATS